MDSNTFWYVFYYRWIFDAYKAPKSKRNFTESRKYEFYQLCRNHNQNNSSSWTDFVGRQFKITRHIQNFWMVYVFNFSSLIFCSTTTSSQIFGKGSQCIKACLFSINFAIVFLNWYITYLLRNIKNESNQTL